MGSTTVGAEVVYLLSVAEVGCFNVYRWFMFMFMVQFVVLRSFAFGFFGETHWWEMPRADQNRPSCPNRRPPSIYLSPATQGNERTGFSQKNDLYRKDFSHD